MVDFNSEITIGTPAVDIVRVLFLQRRSDALEALEFCDKKRRAGVDFPTDTATSRMFSFFLEIQPVLVRRLSKESLQELALLAQSADYKQLVTAFTLMNQILDDIKLTRIDSGKQIDTTDVESENEEKGI